ncbi:lipase [Gordonia sp. ABSL11-1]|nr:lipase [Gordonia sp. ABSL11-1]MDL9948875.1 lipase [Gordonia sp. ABSL11-1]
MSTSARLGILIALVAIAAGLVSPIAAGTADAHPVRVPAIPVVYVSGSNEVPETAAVPAAALRRAGFDTHVFMTWVPSRPETSPYVTVKGNSRRLAAFVDGVRRKTGARKVDIVTVSQGGLVTRYWLKEFGGAPSVRRAVILSGMIKGAGFQADALRNGQCPPAGYENFVPAHLRKNPTDACLEMAMGGAEVTRLNTPTEALPGISYVNITTRRDENATPWQVNLMSGPGTYQNIVLDDHCPRDPLSHYTLTLLPSIQSGVTRALKGERVRFDCMF